MANVLNTYFSTIGPKINADMHKLAAPSFESCKLNINGFRFEQIDESIVSRMLLSLSNHKNGGMAQIPTYMYKLIAKFIVAPLTLKLSAQPYGQPNAKYVHFCTCTRYLMCT